MQASEFTIFYLVLHLTVWSNQSYPSSRCTFSVSVHLLARCSTDPNHSPGSILLLHNIDLPTYPPFGRNVLLFDESYHPAASLTFRFSCPFNCNILQGKFFDMHKVEQSPALRNCLRSEKAYSSCVNSSKRVDKSRYRAEGPRDGGKDNPFRLLPNTIKPPLFRLFSIRLNSVL